MTLEAVELSNKEKLEILRQLDHFRPWASLDERRFCLECQRLFSGYEIRVVKDSLDPNCMQLLCPTDACPSIPMDWTLPTEKIMAALENRISGSQHNRPPR